MGQLKVLASDKAGYGRDASITYYNGDENNEQMLYISFLDYDQNGDAKIARLLVLQPIT